MPPKPPYHDFRRMTLSTGVGTALLASVIIVLVTVRADTITQSRFYRSENGHTLEFSGRRAYFTIQPAPPIEIAYELIDHQIVLHAPGGQVVLDRMGDHLRAASLGMTFEPH